MNYLYRMLSWILGIAIVFCVLLFGWRILLNQSREESSNPYEYDIERYRHVDPALIHYSESTPITIKAQSFHALAVDSNGDIFVSADSRLDRYNSSGSLLKSTDLESPCYGIAIGTERIYLAMRNHISVYNKALPTQTTWSDLGSDARLTSIALAKDHVYVADSGNRRVWQFDLDGKLKGNIPSRSSNAKEKHYIVPSPYFDVAIGPIPANDTASPDVWVANPGRTRVERFDSKGSSVSQWGAPGMTIGNFSGCCNPNHIAITPDGRIATSEKGLPRIRIFDTDGTLISVVAGPMSFSKTPQGCKAEALIKDIAVDYNGRVLVLDRGTGTVRIFVKKAE